MVPVAPIDYEIGNSKWGYLKRHILVQVYINLASKSAPLHGPSSQTSASSYIKTRLKRQIWGIFWLAHFGPLNNIEMDRLNSDLFGKKKLKQKWRKCGPWGHFYSSNRTNLSLAGLVVKAYIALITLSVPFTLTSFSLWKNTTVIKTVHSFFFNYHFFASSFQNQRNKQKTQMIKNTI